MTDSIYLDHSGSTVPSKTLMDTFASELSTVLYGNPHSGSLPSQLSTDQVDDVRLRLLEFFNADTDEFDLIFVANATAGIKLVLEALRQTPGGFNYAYHQACHTSLVGIREEAITSACVDDEKVTQWVEGSYPFLQAAGPSATLFAYSAQSHMNGQRYPLSWAGDIKRTSPSNHQIYTLLDAASLGATSRLNLSHPDFAADFVVLSLYKIFGFPDLGVLLVRKSAEHVFDQRKYFGGGTVDMVVCGKEDWHARKCNFLHERLEDGTLPFHNIIAAGIALRTHESLFGSMANVSRHTASLTRRLETGLRDLKHGNGRQVCTIYSVASDLGSGPIVSFNIKSSLGAWIGLGEFEKLAIINKVHVRTGGLCSPGGIAAALDLQPWEMKKNFSAGFRCGLDNEIMNGKPVGVVRASLGAMSIRKDVDGFLDFIREFFVEETAPQLPEQLPLHDMAGAASLIVKAITVYPIKSCGGFAVPPGANWAVRAEGLAWDREWCLLHRGSGQALSQKRYPRMALLRPILDFEAGTLRIDFEHSDGPQSVSVPLSADPSQLEPDVRHVRSRVCGDEISAQMYKSEQINSFFSEALGVSCVLARFPPGGLGLGARLNKAKMQQHQQSDKVQRLLPGSFPDDVPSPPESDSEKKSPQKSKILLANESPILMIHSASLDALNESISQNGGSPATAAAFRANVVLEAPKTDSRNVRSAYSEDSWRKVRIGSQSFSLLGACRRCQMVCVDQKTAERRQEPLATLSKTRRFNGKIYFGAHMKHDALEIPSDVNQHPTIRIGEQVVVD